MTLFGTNTNALCIVDVATENHQKFAKENQLEDYEMAECEILDYAERLKFYDMLDHWLEHSDIDSNANLCIEMDCVCDELTDTIHHIECLFAVNGISMDILRTDEGNREGDEIFNKTYPYRALLLDDVWEILFGENYGDIRINMYIVKLNGECINLYEIGEI